MFQQYQGGISLPAQLSESHHDSVLGLGSRAKTLRETDTKHDKSTHIHILLAVVVHSVPTSSVTVLFSITVNTLTVESLPLVSRMSRFKTFQLHTH